MPPARAPVLTAVVSSILWVGIGAAGTTVAYQAVLPSGLAALLLPPTLPGSVWFAPLPQLAVGAAIGGAVHAGILALLLPAVARRAGRFVPIWFAAIMAGLLASGGLVVIAAGAAAVLLLPGVAASRTAPVAAAPSPAPTRLGWAGIAPPSPTPVPGGCASDDVTVTLGAEDAATGHRLLPIRVTNTSGSACSVEGYPDVVFDDAEGDAMDVLVVHGGSFLTTDDGPVRVRLTPGASAEADLGWNAQSASGDRRAGRMLVSVRPGEPRLPADVDLDVQDGGAVALTAWKRVVG